MTRLRRICARTGSPHQTHGASGLWNLAVHLFPEQAAEPRVMPTGAHFAPAAQHCSQRATESRSNAPRDVVASRATGGNGYPRKDGGARPMTSPVARSPPHGLSVSRRSMPPSLPSDLEIRLGDVAGDVDPARIIQDL